MLKTTWEDEYAFILRLGTARVMSVAVVMFRLPRDSEPSAVTEMPTSCRRSSRRLAVTKISSRARSPVAAGCWASASTGAAASAAQVNRNRTQVSSLDSRFDMCPPECSGGLRMLPHLLLERIIMEDGAPVQAFCAPLTRARHCPAPTC